MAVTARDRVVPVLVEMAGRVASYWLPARWRARMDLAERRVVRRKLRWAVVHTLLLFGLRTIGARIREEDAERRARLRGELGREPTDDEVRAAYLDERGIDPAACRIPRHDEP